MDEEEIMARKKVIYRAISMDKSNLKIFIKVDLKNRYKNTKNAVR